MEYILHLLILIIIYTMLAQSLSLVAGYAGMVSLAQAGYYGIGAYTTAILSVKYGLSVIFTLPIAMVVCGIIAIIISSIALRTVDDYFIICTLGIQVLIFALFNNWINLTKGPMGIAGIPQISFIGFTLDNKIAYLIFSSVLFVLVYLILNKIVKSPFGRILEALSEDEIFTQSLGKNVYKAKVLTFTLGAVIAAIPGVLYAHYISYIDPTSFTVDESIFILSIVIIGGMKNLKGIVFSAAFLVLLPEALRFIGLPNNIAANLRQIIYGVIIVIYVFRFSGKIYLEKN
jgi:branched-chain amino acid transport system permease protein